MTLTARRQKLVLDRGRRRARRLGIALGGTLALAAPLLAGPAPTLANHAPRECTSNQQQGTLCLTVSDTPDPVSYSRFDGNITFLKYVADVTNASRNSALSHGTLHEVLPEGTTVVRTTTSRGSCSSTTRSVDCTFGTLKKGEGATVEVVVTAPETSESIPPDRVITNVATAAFDERFSDQPGGRQDTITYSETTTVSRTAGQTFIPKGHSGKVDTDPAQLQYANASIRSASTDVLAKVKVLAPDAFCLSGRVTIEGRTYVCRAGAFVDASVVEADTGELYNGCPGGGAPCNPLVFHLRWDGTLTFPWENTKKTVGFLEESANGPVQVIEERCPAIDPDTDACLTNVKREADGGLSFDLVKQTDPRMR